MDSVSSAIYCYKMLCSLLAPEKPAQITPRAGGHHNKAVAMMQSFKFHSVYMNGEETGRC